MKKLSISLLLLLLTLSLSACNSNDEVDEEAPVILEVSEIQREFVEGATAPNWATYITALDNIDGDISILSTMVDTDNVDMDTIGTFDVIYTVEDEAGNITSFTITITIIEYTEYTVGPVQYNYEFNTDYSGELALPTILEGNGYVVNDSGYAETIYFQDSTMHFGNADSWTFVSHGYDKEIHNFMIEAKVIALGHENDNESPIFSIRVDYDWMLDIHFNFNNDSWSGVAIHNVPGGSRYSNDPAVGGLDPNEEIQLELNTEYVFKILIVDSDTAGEDIIIVYINDVKIMETNIPDVDLNAQHIMGASQGSHIKVDYFKAYLVTLNN
jgi:hypothetical protein